MTEPPRFTVVTGAGGWLGRSLTEALASRQGTVRLLAHNADEATSLQGLAPAAEIIVGDLRSPDVADRLLDGGRGATIFHLAAIIHARGGTQEVFDTNVGGTAIVLDRAKRAGVRRLVYLSSSSPMGHNDSENDVFVEDSPYRPFGAYGRSKMEAESLVRRAVEVGDVDTTIVRCPWFYGPHQPERQTRFFKLVRRGLFPMTGSGNQRRSLAYTGNIVQGLCLAEVSPRASGESYWIADERPYAFREIVRAVQDALRAEGLRAAKRNIRLPGILSRSAAVADRTLERLGLYVEPLHVLAEVDRTIACDISKAREHLGYAPEIEIDEGMRRSVRWCLDNDVDL